VSGWELLRPCELSSTSSADQEDTASLGYTKVILVTMTSLRRFESAVDAAFASYQLPHPNMHVAAWYLITVSEDHQRLLLISPKEDMSDWRVEFFLDKYKFALRHCLAAVRQTASDRTVTALPVKVISMLYLRTARVLKAGIEYSIAAQICASAHTGGVHLVNDSDGFVVESDEQLLDMRYGALELMRQSAEESTVPALSAFLWTWMRHTELVPTVVHKIAASTRLLKRRIRYTYEPELSYELSLCLGQPPLFIPDGWLFPWGSRNETTLLLNSFCLRIFYHILAVHFGAARVGLRGGAEADICLTLSREQLAHDIAMNSSLQSAQINLFIDYITYGRGVDSPDQALQPLVPLGSQQFGVAGIGLLSSNVERNLLTLQARLEPRLFDSQSSLFEVEMTNKLADVFRQKWKLVEANRTFKLGSTREELDLLICEPDTKTVLLLELRWILPPADPREVQTKKRTCFQKVDQAERKLASARGNLANLMDSAFGINLESPGEWSVYGAVVIQGFGGACSQCELIPIVPDWVLEAGVRTTRSLQRLAEWTKSLDWLPVNGRDFTAQEDPSVLLDINVKYPGIAPTRPGRDYLKDATATLRIV
jgi:hypothetical protein